MLFWIWLASPLAFLLGYAVVVGNEMSGIGGRARGAASVLAFVLAAAALGAFISITLLGVWNSFSPLEVSWR